MRAIMILILLVGVGCEERETTPEQKQKEQADLNQPHLKNGNDLERYETTEVVCFENIHTNNVLWCHWKGEQPK